MEVSLLQTQNHDLNADNQRIMSILVHLRHTFDFMQGLVNSLRNAHSQVICILNDYTAVICGISIPKLDHADILVSYFCGSCRT